MKKLIKIAVVMLCAMLFSTTVMAADIATVDVDVLNVRESKSLEAPVLGQLKKNTPVSVLESADGWSRIAYQGGEAYVLGQYINVQFLEDGVTFLYGVPKFGQVQVDALNVRVAASFEVEYSRQLRRNEKIELIGESGEFYMIQEADGAIRFVAKAYVAEITYDEYKQANSMGEEVVRVASQYMGTPYVYGGRSPSGFDCSGFTSYVYEKMGVSINRTASAQMQNGYYVSLEEMQPGDLVFFANGGYVSHVGIYIGDGNMIHSPYPGKRVCIESIYNSYFAPRLYGARRIF